jgi:hypothetical protein
MAYRWMTSHIMSLDMREVCSLFESWNLPVQMFQPCVDFGITLSARQLGILVSDSSDVGLEMLHVDRIEADDCGIQSDIRLSEFVTQKVFSRGFRKHLLQTIKRLEQRKHIVLICLLSSSKTTFVHPNISFSHEQTHY